MKTKQVTLSQLDQLQESTAISMSRKFTSEHPDCGLILDMDGAEDGEREAVRAAIPDMDADFSYCHFFH